MPVRTLGRCFRPLRSLHDDRQGATVVVGVIILIGIAVGLATAVFLVANKATEGQNEPPPPIGVAMDPGHAQMSIVKAPEDLLLHYAPNAGDTGLRWSGDCDVVAINGQPPTSTMVVSAGDRIETDCSAGQSLALIDSDSNSVVAVLRVP